MKAALKKTFHKSDGSEGATSKIQHDRPPSAPRIPISTISRPTPTDILRHRYHHSVNLGGIFVLERWLHPSMFDPTSTGSSELDAVTASLATRGLAATRAKWETHWSSALSDATLHWLVHAAHCTTIRLPVGYFTLGPGFCKGTPFAPVTGVYVNAWAAVKRIVERCREFGVGVLVDFHALPGGANGEAHSGTERGVAGIWGREKELGRAVECLRFMALEVTGGDMDGVVGIQVCNEAQWQAKGLYRFYDAAIEKIAEVDPTLPVYISDAWNLDVAMRYAVGKNGVRGLLSNPVIVDTHRYYTFAEKDTSRSPQELIAQIATELSELGGLRGSISKQKGACDVYVGEYSCTLSKETWTRVPEGRRAALAFQFGQVQSRKWQQRTCGSAFWTLHMDWMPGGDWGFQEQVDNGSITAPRNLSIPVVDIVQQGEAAERVRSDCMNRAVSAHVSYWDEHAPDTQFEHWLFADGWKLGWADARDFFLARSTGILFTGASTTPNSKKSGTGVKDVSNGGDTIGVMESWVLKRMKEMGCADQARCVFGWEFEQGFRQGISAFYIAVGI